MRNQLKPSLVDTVTLFNFEGKELEKGGWTLLYKVPPRDADGNFDFNELLIGSAYKCEVSNIKLPFLRFFDYLDENGDPYASYDAFIDDLGTLLDLGSSGGGGTPGGANTNVQFNDVDAFAGDSEFIFNKTTKALTVGTSVEEASAIGNFDSTTQGFLHPRMDTTQRDAIASPASGLQIYNTDSDLPEFFNGSIWVTTTSAASSVLGTIPYFIDTFNNSTKDPYPARSTGGSASTFIGFRLPSDFGNITELKIPVIPNGTIVAEDIDVTINSNVDGTLFTVNSVVDTTSTFSFTVDEIGTIDLLTLFNTLPPAALVPGANVGIEIDHNGIGTTLYYISGSAEYFRLESLPTEAMPEGTIKGRAIGSGSGVPINMSPGQVRSVINVADGANAYVHPNHSGDVVSVSDGIQTIQPNVVTNSMLVDVATATIMGRITGGSGSQEILSPANVRTIINVADGATANSTDAFLLARANHTGTQLLSTISDSGALAALDTVSSTEIDADSVSNIEAANMATATIKGRISGGSGNPEDLSPASVRTVINVADGATANSSDAFLLARANHTGTQTLATISDSGALAALSTITTTQITDGTVANVDLADMAQKTIKGRADAAGTGAPVDLSPAQVRDIADLNTTDSPTFTGVTVSAAPTVGTDLVNKTYADAIGSSRDPKESSRLATTQILDDNASISGSPSYDDTGGSSARGQITATLSVSDTFTVDGITIAAADDGTRFLIKNEGDGSGLGADANGIYTSTISGTSLTLDRATDFDADGEVGNGASTIIGEGTVNAARTYVLTTADPITIGGASGTDLTFTNSSPDASPTNLSNSRTSTTVTVESSTGTDTVLAVADGSNAGVYPSADFTKLAGIATAATANSTDAFLLARANHTGTQLLSTISDSGALAALSVVGTTEITDNSVTDAKTADVSTSTIKGRITAGSGDLENLTGANVRTIINVADGATANSSDAFLLARANHTGTQTLSTISDSGALAALSTVDTAQVVDGAITNAKKADVSTATFSGRITAGTGSPETLSATQARTILNVADGAQVNDANTALTNVANTYTKQQNFGEATLADAANISWNLDDEQTAKVTPTGTRILDNPTNQVAGGTYLLRVIGAGDLTFGSAYKWPSGTAPTFTGAPSSIDILTFYSDGTNMNGVSQLNFS